MVSSDYGGIAENELAAFMASGPKFADAGVGITARFARATGKLIHSRQPKGEPGGLAVFVLSQSLATDTKDRTVKSNPLLANGNDAILGEIWLVQAELKSAASIQKLSWDASTVKETLLDIDLGTRPTIVLDARSEPWQPRLYPLGMEQEEFWISIDVSDGPIAESILKETLERFWRQCLRTPTLANQATQKLWKRASKGVPMPRPEQRVQFRLRDTLVGAFPRRRIRAEVRTDEGRGDIFIMADTTSEIGTPAQSTDWVLELKAMCDVTSAGKEMPDADARSREAISKGVVQAIAYRTDQNGVQAALCCYEMRKSEEDDISFFTHVASNAAVHQIRLWRWIVFRSDNDSRMKRYAMVSA